MADRQFVVPGQGAAPFEYLLSADQDLLPRTAYATFDGALAAVPFKPCLRLISDSGHVAAEAVAETQVAAGGSADVSWFRRLKPPCPPNGWPNTNHTDDVLLFDPWAYWKLNEPDAAATAIDYSGHSRNLSILNAFVTGGRSGIVPTSSDTSSFVVWSSSTIIAPWRTTIAQTWTPAVGSWEYWLNSPGHSPNELDLGILGTLGSAASRVFRQYLNASGQPVFEFQDTGGALHTFTSPVGVVDNSTHQLVWVLDGTNLTLYVDGAQADQQAQGATMKNPFTATLSLGMVLGGAGTRFYTGLLEHVAWYDKVLSAANVTTLYDAGTQI